MVGIEWDGMEHVLIFSLHDKYKCAYAWICVLCTDTVNRPRPFISYNSFIIGLSEIVLSK